VLDNAAIAAKRHHYNINAFVDRRPPPIPA
jgi:hypothetical protein